MRLYGLSFIAAIATVAVLDVSWVGVVARGFYRRGLGHLMADQVLWPPVILFYLLYSAGVVYFAARPGSVGNSYALPACNGALLGLLVYGTYNLTNLALLKDWPLPVVLVDISWGMFLTAAAAMAAFYAGR